MLFLFLAPQARSAQHKIQRKWSHPISTYPNVRARLPVKWIRRENNPTLVYRKKHEYIQGMLIFSLFRFDFCEVSSFTLRNKAKMRFLIVADFSLQQRGKYTESFLIIKGFEKKMRLSQDFSSAVTTSFRGGRGCASGLAIPAPRQGNPCAFTTPDYATLIWG